MNRPISLLGLLVGALVGCGSPDDGPLGPQPAEVVYGAIKQRDRSGKAEGADFTAVVAAQTALSIRLLGALRDANPDKNLAISGYSINQVLGMLYAGARGATAEAMKTALNWDLPPQRFHSAMNALDLEILSRGDDVTLAIANRVWVQKGLPLLPAFLDTLTRDYGAPLAVADFTGAAEKARTGINDWVKRATRDKIPTLFPMGTIGSNTRLVLANALYLDAPWKYKFNSASTGKVPFTLLSGEKVPVDMMHYGEFLPSTSTRDYSAVELPYRGDELAMVIIVPQDLQKFEAGLSPGRLGEVFAQLRNGGIHLSLPKLSFSFHASLNESLRGIGLGSLFETADFSGITGSADLSVAHFEHEVFVEVDEEGTKAAAATGASLAASHGPTVQADRPFLFAIRDRPTGAVLFLGRVIDPRSSGR